MIIKKPDMWRPAMSVFAIDSMSHRPEGTYYNNNKKQNEQKILGKNCHAVYIDYFIQPYKLPFLFLFNKKIYPFLYIKYLFT
jgi:hypothetical protein